MERPAYVNATLFDSKALAQQAALNSSPSSGIPGGALDQPMDLSELMPKNSMDKMTSSKLLPETRLKSHRLSVSPRRLKVFHYHEPSQDNGILQNIKDNRNQIQIGSNLVRIKHNQRQDRSQEIMDENRKILGRLMNSSSKGYEPSELKKRAKKLDKIKK